MGQSRQKSRRGVGILGRIAARQANRDKNRDRLSRFAVVRRQDRRSRQEAWRPPGSLGRLHIAVSQPRRPGGLRRPGGTGLDAPAAAAAPGGSGFDDAAV